MTPKQKRFVEEYLVDLNATQAAIRAGYSERTAYSQGQRLLKNVEIQKAMSVAMENRSSATEITAEKVLTELARIAFSDHSGIVKYEKGRVVVTETEKLNEDQRRVISELSQVDTNAGTSIKVKLYDKQKALELLGRHLGLFPNKVEMSGPGGGPIKTEQLSDSDLEHIASCGG